MTAALELAGIERPAMGTRDSRETEPCLLPSSRARALDEATAAHAGLALIAGKWTVDVLIALRDRPLRFGMLSRALDHIARKVLTQTLRCMQRDGLIWRRSSGIVGKPVEYGLTPLGTSLLDRVCGFAEWSMHHIGTVEASRATFNAFALESRGTDARRERASWIRRQASCP